MKNILACSKFSSEGIQVAKTAIELAEKINGNVYLLKLKSERTSEMQLTPSGGNKIAIEEEIEDPETFIFQLACQEDVIADVPLAYAGENLETLKDYNCDRVSLVITCDEDDQAATALNPATTFKKLDCPVLKLPYNATMHEPSRIAYVTDLRYFDVALFTPFIELFKAYNPEIMVIHITASGLPDIENDYAELLFSEQIVPRLGYNNFSLINLLGRDIVNDMQNVTEVMQPDMLVLGSRIHGYYERLFNGSGAKTAYSQLPLVLFN